MATDIENLASIRSSYIASLKAEAEYQEANGAKPDYSLDGESVQWEVWRDGMVERIEKLTYLIQKLGGPVRVVSRGRA